MKKVEVSITSISDTKVSILRKTLINNEEKYNDYRKYITITNTSTLSDFTTVLKTLPEFIAGKTATVTNTGLIWFSGKYAYDLTLLEAAENDSIVPDFTSTVEFYTEYNNPLGIRKMSVTNDGIVGDVYYKSDNKYCFMLDCDRINNVDPRNDGFFEDTKYIYTAADLIGFEYKQMYTIKTSGCYVSIERVIDNNSFSKTDSREDNDNNTNTFLDFIQIDCSDEYTPYVYFKFTFTDVKPNAYVEVI